MLFFLSVTPYFLSFLPHPLLVFTELPELSLGLFNVYLHFAAATSYKPVSRSCTVAKGENCWRTTGQWNLAELEWKTAPLCEYENLLTLEAFVTASRLDAKYNCLVTCQNSLLCMTVKLADRGFSWQPCWRKGTVYFRSSGFMKSILVQEMFIGICSTYSI